MLFVNLYFRAKVLKVYGVLVRNRVQFGAAHLFEPAKVGRRGVVPVSAISRRDRILYPPHTLLHQDGHRSDCTHHGLWRRIDVFQINFPCLIMKKLKIGLLGAGHLGKIHLKCILATEQWELAGFYEPGERNAASAIAQYSARRFQTVDELLNAVDAVDIVTRQRRVITPWQPKPSGPANTYLSKSRLHKRFIREGNCYGWPTCTGVKVQVGHVERFNPAYLALQRHDVAADVHRKPPPGRFSAPGHGSVGHS
jgi:hypothetical protein